MFNTLHYILGFLKAYSINSIVACPGTQNSTFNLFAQENPFFKCYSVVDERSAGYVAIGLAQQLNKPVVITCTGATSSRNFLASMTEAYYSHIPLIALTFYSRVSNRFALSAQFLDRSVIQNDAKSLAVNLQEIHDQQDKQEVLTSINAALCHCTFLSAPVHINAPSAFDYSEKTLPEDIWKTDVINREYNQLIPEFNGKRIACFIGKHNRFLPAETEAISNFAQVYNCPIICEHSSNYTGANKVLTPTFHYVADALLRPELIIDLGGVSSIYANGSIFASATYWSVCNNFEYAARENSKVRKILVGPLDVIFRELSANHLPEPNSYYSKVKDVLTRIDSIDYPYSTTYVTQRLARMLPEKAVLHTSIIMPTQNLNFFYMKKPEIFISNTGGFGIDGAISTAFGQSLATYKPVYCICGDLAYFYDMNILGNRNLKPNLRILLINNK